MRVPWLITTAIALAAWLSCSAPEAFRPGRAGLTNGTAGAAGSAVAPAGASGSDAGAMAGDGGAAGSATGVAGSGPGGIGAAGADAGAAGTGAAGSGAAGMGAAGTGAAGSGAAGSGVAGTGAAGAAGTGAAGASAAGAAGTAPPPTLLSLPMTVSDHFAPTGGMGDAAVVGAVTIGTDATACAGEPAAATVGTCYSMTYHPQPIVAPATTTWAGFYWQYPDNNWGAQQPLTIAAGGKDISFYAKGMAGGESVTFQAGGILNTVSTATPYTDAFTVRMTFTLTTTWTKYTLPLTGLTYSGGVLGGFAWVATAPNANAISFRVHGIIWE